MHIRIIQPEDNPAVAAIIRKVMIEFSASGPGFAIHDTEVDDMFSSYSNPRSAYFVVTKNKRVFGGGGVAPLSGGSTDICELRKMYFLSEIRGHGLGQKIMDSCLEAARKFDFKQCYLETLASMNQAKILYAKNGFTPINTPLGSTGHFGCDNWYIKKI